MFPKSPAIVHAAGYGEALAGLTPEGWPARELAQRLGVSPRALRYYGEKKLMPPARLGPHRQHYRGDDALRMGFIVACRRVGLSLADIAALLRALDRDPAAIEVLALRLEEHVEDIEHQRAALADQRRLTLDWLDGMGRQPNITLRR